MDKKIRLLYVDDEAAWRNIFRREISEDKRYEIKTAGGGAEALTVLESWTSSRISSHGGRSQATGWMPMCSSLTSWPGTSIS